MENNDHALSGVKSRQKSFGEGVVNLMTKCHRDFWQQRDKCAYECVQSTQAEVGPSRVIRYPTSSRDSAKKGDEKGVGCVQS